MLVVKSNFKDPEGRKLLKTLWEKEKMMISSIFSFSHNVFYRSMMNLAISAKFKLSSANTV